MRKHLDQYNTPLWVTQELINEFPEIRGNILLDPCCGNGSMAKFLQKHHRFNSLILNDIEPKIDFCASHDATQETFWNNEQYPDWVITNPPFLQAGQIVKHALTYARLGVAMLLRATFLEPCKGREWIIESPPTAILSLPRISFTENGACDSVPSWWMIWSQVVRPRISVSDYRIKSHSYNLIK